MKNLLNKKINEEKFLENEKKPRSEIYKIKNIDYKTDVIEEEDFESEKNFEKKNYQIFRKNENLENSKGGVKEILEGGVKEKNENLEKERKYHIFDNNFDFRNTNKNELDFKNFNINDLKSQENSEKIVKNENLEKKNFEEKKNSILDERESMEIFSDVMMKKKNSNNKVLF